MASTQKKKSGILITVIFCNEQQEDQMLFRLLCHSGEEQLGEKKKVKTQIISQTCSKGPGPAAFNKLVLTTL